MIQHYYTAQETHRRKIIYFCMHMFVLLLSLFLIVTISVDTFKNVAFYREPQFMEIDFWICILFLLDFFVEWAISERKWRYLSTHFLFLLVSIPYSAIIQYYGWTFEPKVAYLIRYIPLVRGGYALAMVVNWLTSNRATGLFLAYTISLIATLYFASVVFFVFEQDTNPLVKTYSDALWWAAMDMTTVGSNIIAVTPIGKILSVLLAALGMMLFPIFTVYITNLIQSRNQRGWIIGQGNFDNEAQSEDTDHTAQPAIASAPADSAAKSDTSSSVPEAASGATDVSDTSSGTSSQSEADISSTATSSGPSNSIH